MFRLYIVLGGNEGIGGAREGTLGYAHSWCTEVKSLAIAGVRSVPSHSHLGQVSSLLIF